MGNFRSGRHVSHRLNADLVLTTKYRRGAPLETIKAYVETQNAPERDRRGAAGRARFREGKNDGKKKDA